jgi:hypothetical protein
MPYLEGMALRITAIALPFVVVTPYDPSRPAPITLDVRATALMPVSKEFAEAQVDRYADLNRGRRPASEGGNFNDDDRTTRQADR